MASQKYNKLAGKHVLVIGGTSGIGYCVAEASLASGATVTISSSSSDRVATSISSLKSSFPSGAVSGYPCDLSKPTVEADIEALFEKTGKVDHIVFTAGDKLAMRAVDDITLESIIAAGQVRMFAPMLVAKVGKRYLNPGPRSSIVFTTGTAGDRPMKNWSTITAFATGIHGMTRALALELQPIRVNCVCPGAVKTPLWGDLTAEHKEGLFKSIGEKAMTGAIGEPEDVAEAYVWLMKDANVTGFVAYSESGTMLT